MSRTQSGAVAILLPMLFWILAFWIAGGSDRVIVWLASSTGALLLGWFGLSYLLTHAGRK